MKHISPIDNTELTLNKLKENKRPTQSIHNTKHMDSSKSMHMLETDSKFIQLARSCNKRAMEQPTGRCQTPTVRGGSL